MLYLVADMAMAGLLHSRLSPADRADFFDALCIFLPESESEAARYAATCLRESERAQQDFLAALEIKKATT
jgi:hypothetical protein